MTIPPGCEAYTVLQQMDMGYLMCTHILGVCPGWWYTPRGVRHKQVYTRVDSEAQNNGPSPGDQTQGLRIGRKLSKVWPIVDEAIQHKQLTVLSHATHHFMCNKHQNAACMHVVCNVFNGVELALFLRWSPVMRKTAGLVTAGRWYSVRVAAQQLVKVS